MNVICSNAIIIEDEMLLASQLKFILSNQGFAVTTYHNAEEFIHGLSAIKGPSLFLIDLNLPGLKGIEIVKLIRLKDKVSPIFMISGSADEHEISECFKSGADDFLQKPFNLEHLSFKLINTQVKLKLLMSNIYNVGINLVPEGCLVMKNNLKVKLTKREFSILEQLIKVPDGIHTREELVTALGDVEIIDRTIDVHISSLRKKLKNLNVQIDTIRGQGYRVAIG